MTRRTKPATTSAVVEQPFTPAPAPLFFRTSFYCMSISLQESKLYFISSPFGDPGPTSGPRDP